jgi:hypothetical protein
MPTTSLRPSLPSFVLKEFKLHGRILWAVPEFVGCECCVNSNLSDLPCEALRRQFGESCISNQREDKSGVVFIDAEDADKYVVEATAAKFRS